MAENSAENARSGLRAALVVAVRDGIGLIGAGSFVYGVSEIYRPAAFLVAGAMLIALAVAMARKNA